MSGQTKTAVVEIRVTPAELADWKRWAEGQSLSVSELIRRQMRGLEFALPRSTGLGSEASYAPSDNRAAKQSGPVTAGKTAQGSGFRPNVVRSLARSEVTPLFRKPKK